MRALIQKQKIFLSLALIAELSFLAPLPAQAGLFGGGGGIKIPSASQIASELENRYNLNLGSIQNQGQNLNVADSKKQVPEVKLFFTPTDPKPGEKLTTRAFPMFFTNQESSLYYTWYLKHGECDLTDSPSDRESALCDRDDDGEITVEDWKVEATSLIAQNSFDREDASYSSDSDNDGYRARFGGDNKVNTTDFCYVHDSITGNNYELAKNIRDADFPNCSGEVVCMETSGEILSGENQGDSPGGPYFTTTSNSGTCYVSGYPACSNDAPVCPTGTAMCVSDATANTCGTAITSCTSISQSTADPYCRHLFPRVSDSGNGTFGASEEEFWGTNPNDPDTAGNGNKDEANVVGLGINSFTWNYVAGDKVGVAVEGTSLIPTKHNDSSSMIMWAFAKNDCPVALADERGSYTTSIQGYRVKILAADMDINKCIAYLDGDGDERELNLVDPTEGGQATNLELSVKATPDGPVNDESGDRGGDIVTAQASVDNSDRGINNVLFDWTVEISDNAQFLGAAGATTDITDELRDQGLLGNSRGNALDAIRLKMDMPNSLVDPYLEGSTGYLRFSVRATENFSNDPPVIRKGRGSVVVKFTSTEKKITAYKTTAVLVGDTMRVRRSNTVICNNDPLERSLCPVVKNEIIGLRIAESGLSSFRWSVNGQALTCTKESVSDDCTDGEQNAVNFIPIAGNTGDTYTVTVAATNIATGVAMNLSRTFLIVDPQVFIESVNTDLAWTKLIGQYRDISGSAENCLNGLCNDYSTSVFQATGGSELAFRAKFLPSFLGAEDDLVTTEWFVDGVPAEEDSSGEIHFTADKLAPSVYNIEVAARWEQRDAIRRALFDIWNISPIETPEANFSANSQVEVGENELATGPLGETGKAFAALLSYIPASLLFSFRILLSAILIIFVTGFLFALIPAQPRLLQTRKRQ